LRRKCIGAKAIHRNDEINANTLISSGTSCKLIKRSFKRFWRYQGWKCWHE